MNLIETASPAPSPHDSEYRMHGVSNLNFKNISNSSSIWMKYRRTARNGPIQDFPLDRLSLDNFLAQYIKTKRVRSATERLSLYLKGHDKTQETHDVITKYLRCHEGKSADLIVDNPQHDSQRDKGPELEASLKDSVPDKEQREITQGKRVIPSESPHYIQTTSDSHIVKTLPEEFKDCFIEDLISLLSRLLKSLIKLNDQKVPSSVLNPSEGTSNNSVLTRYHSRTPPLISTQNYLTRLTKFNSFTPATLLTTIYYIDLLSHHYHPFFTLNSWTVHRFLLVGTMLSQKSMEDFFYTNDHYAKVGGVALGELNCLELDFLTRVDWRCVPAKQMGDGKSSIKFAKDVLDLYYHQLISLMGRNTSKGDEVHFILKSLCSNTSDKLSLESGIGRDNGSVKDNANDFDDENDDDSMDDSDEHSVSSMNTARKKCSSESNIPDMRRDNSTNSEISTILPDGKGYKYDLHLNDFSRKKRRYSNGVTNNILT
ncbi:Piso0_002231 [Millerozyma farinosa CBS 7064]|uniref:Piso0_002231 protein n=1 Tax=Pichia sorbitophila (strain ATCC MYA-4447 / BCRC 22081 / CBS 7064 / NBRC 10061 / NRRL Y-12695) TaxID=559304 RepID=G8YC23_PICSO|nr:Piso0_002231 [Millerozyma farinosa CBS 7064]